MSKLITNKNLTIINFVIVTYFILLYLLSNYKIDSILIGFFVESLTIPFLISQVFFLFLGIKHLIEKNDRYYPLILSLILLIICSMLTIGSVFKERI